MATAKRTTATRIPKTSADLKLELEKAKLKVAELEKLAYAGVLEELVAKTNIVESFKTVKGAADGATDIAILAAIAKAIGLVRIEITQLPAPKRASTPRKTAVAK